MTNSISRSSRYRRTAARSTMRGWSARAIRSPRVPRTARSLCCASAKPWPRAISMQQSMTASALPCGSDVDRQKKAQVRATTIDTLKWEKTMTYYRNNGNRVPQFVHAMAKEAREGRLDRREFLAIASALGASTALAYGMIGLAEPQPAFAQSPTKGGTLRVAMAVKGQKDPRTYDWVE